MQLAERSPAGKPLADEVWSEILTVISRQVRAMATPGASFQFCPGPTGRDCPSTDQNASPVRRLPCCRQSPVPTTTRHRQEERNEADRGVPEPPTGGLGEEAQQSNGPYRSQTRLIYE